MTCLRHKASEILVTTVSCNGQGPVHGKKWHYSDVMMRSMASPITSLTIVYSTVYPGADQRKHQTSASLAFVMGNLPVTGFHLMTTSWGRMQWCDSINTISTLKSMWPKGIHLQSSMIIKKGIIGKCTQSVWQIKLHEWWKFIEVSSECIGNDQDQGKDIC